MSYSDAYDRLVKDDGDIAGLVAYGIYKKAKRSFIRQKQAEFGVTMISDDILEEFYANQTDYALELYKMHANTMTREFLDESYKKDLAQEKQQLDEKHNERYNKLAEAVKPSFWFGVLQGFVASFLFVLAGYIILKMNGSWDILLNNLFK